MTRAVRHAASWKAWTWLPLAVTVVVIEVLILADLLSRDWTGVVVAGSLIVIFGGRVLDHSKKLRAKLPNR
jgi:hypothetical protein